MATKFFNMVVKVYDSGKCVDKYVMVRARNEGEATKKAYAKIRGKKKEVFVSFKEK